MIGGAATTSELVKRARNVGTDHAELEIKSGAGGLPSNVLESVSAFANGQGGTILLGLAESDNFAPAHGFDARKVMDALAGACADKLTPPIRDQIDLDEIDGKSVVRLDVSETDAHDKPCHITARGAYNGSYIRSGDGDRRLTHYEVTQLLSNRSQPVEDAAAVPSATRADLDDELVEALLGRVRRRNRRAFLDLDDAGALVRLGAAVVVDGVLQPTLAGLLCLGSYPQQFFPQLFISFVFVPGSRMGDTTPDGRRFLDNLSIDGAIPQMIEDAVAAVERNMRRAVAVHGARRSDHYDYPLEVVRELVVNAVMHRDYSPGSLGSQVQIELYPDRLEVKSPGGLYGGVDVSQLGTEDVSSSRNAVLAKLLSEVAVGHGRDPVCENRGSGLPTVVRALRESGMSPPEFDAKPGHLFVTVPEHALLSPETITWIGSLPARGLTDAQHLALAMMRTNGSVSNAMLRAWGIESHTATLALTDLVGRRLAVKSGGRRYATYRLTIPAAEKDGLFATDVPVPTTSRHDRIETELAAVVEAVRAGHVTSRAIAAQLGLGYQTTLRRINRLVDGGVLQQTEARHSRHQSYRLTDS